MYKDVNDRLAGIVDLLLDAVFLVDEAGVIVYVNAACEGIFGYTQDEMIGRRMLDMVAPEDRARTSAEGARVQAGEARIGFENRYLCKDGSLVYLMWSARRIPEEGLRLGVARDVTALRRAEARQSAMYAIADAALRAPDLDTLFAEIHRVVAGIVPVAGFAVLSCDCSARRQCFAYQYACDEARGFLQEAIEQRFCRFVGACSEPAWLGRSGANPWLALPLVAQSGAIGALVLEVPPGVRYSERDQALLHYVAAQVAVAVERARLTVELEHAALHDELTGLSNRRHFHACVGQAFARCRRSHMQLALLYVDLDDFKLVNDNYGHAVGDLLLREVAVRLRACVRESDTVARLGGDEFVVVMEEVATREAAVAAMEKIRAALGRGFVLDDGAPLPASASVGYACYPEDGTDAESLLRHADAAMYRGKGGQLQA